MFEVAPRHSFRSATAPATDTGPCPRDRYLAVAMGIEGPTGSIHTEVALTGAEEME